MYDTTKHVIIGENENNIIYITHDENESRLLIMSISYSYSECIDLHADIDKQIQHIRQDNFVNSMFNYNDFVINQFIDAIQERLDELG